MALDATRGVAMLTVFLSHFSDAYCLRLGPAGLALRMKIASLTYLASPTFMLLSGMMLGLLWEGQRDFAATRAKLVDRGLFLLTAGHLLIMIANAPRLTADQSITRLYFITDTIAASIIVGPLLIARFSQRARALLGLSLIVFSWAVVILWMPPTYSQARIAKHLLFGFWRSNTLIYNFPLVPWFGAYFAASALGETVGRWNRQGRSAALERLLLGWGAALIAAGAGLKACYWMLQGSHLLPGGKLGEIALRLSSPTQKLPPAPAYLLFYGGVGLVLTAALLLLERRAIFPALLAHCARLGRNSLFIFILQFYVYYLAIFLLRLEYSRLWPLYFLATLAAMHPLIVLWDRRGWTRYLTLLQLPGQLAWLRPARATAGPR